MVCQQSKSKPNGSFMGDALWLGPRMGTNQKKIGACVLNNGIRTTPVPIMLLRNRPANGPLQRVLSPLSINSLSDAFFFTLCHSKQRSRHGNKKRSDDCNDCSNIPPPTAMEPQTNTQPKEGNVCHWEGEVIRCCKCQSKPRNTMALSGLNILEFPRAS